MKVVERSAIVAFTPAQMFALVDDVPRYPEFLPWCTGARAEQTSPTERLASIDIVKGAIRMQLTTRNTVLAHTHILMELVEGPFRRLVGHWGFSPVGERGSRIVFKVEFEFKSRLMAVAFNPVFESVCDKIVDAF
ncbi:MAG: type II toxin-antitoxin system RatA family toxin, partial [Steroidobacteraceae bacterium]